MTDNQFTIDQLRKDKIIYAVESIAVSVNCIVVIFFAHMYANPYIRDLVTYGAVIMSMGYVLYMGYTNLKRLRKIQQLERDLQ